ncbi:carbon-nitrogen hydrolase family protein [Paenarthrobacter sp. Z7-10]|uniref:carbon-nitrogen hydrolase family protein n=1 Tax=Paenarthrobacter sp. Z7-10 TaxID=2787635 RepID=UPI0022A8EAAF|nr:carbon-nitrogen hydrolase family protein [Paenarthrobacter sp. Z7-10]MCZ2401996.1 carbon-nitrogen hydrolase family protein [Paenarthrobacter sp. Z7-10]
MRIALGQLESGTDIQSNLAVIDRFAAEAAHDGATLVVFPEYATYEKKKVDATFPLMAEPLDGPICQELASTARRHRIALVAGVVESSEEPDKAFNTVVAFGPDGSLLARYRKIHLFDAQGFGESTFIKPGPSTDPVVFEHAGTHFGLMTCYDLRFPELARQLADAGAQVLLVCSSWVPGTHKTEQWLALNAARAIENSLYVVGVCQAPPVSVGRSILVDPMGVTETDLGLASGVTAVNISPETVARVRELFPTLRQRRL